MSAITFDTLKYANALKKSGLTAEQAEAQTEALVSAFETARYDSSAFALKDELKGLATKEELKDLATKGDVEKLRADMREGFALMDSKIARTEANILKWCVGAIFASAGLAMAIARLFLH